MPTQYRRRQPKGDAYTTVRVCTQCGYKRVLVSFPTPPGESRRGDVCNLCIRFPSTVHRAA